MVVIAGTDAPARHRLLDSWAGRLLRSGAGAHDVVRSPLDAVRAGAGILVAALAWWVTKERGGSGWSLTWQWVELALVVVALLGTAGTGLVVVVLALSRRRWSLSALALVAIIACVLLVLGTVHGSAAAATIGWTASVAATAALWPSGLSGLRRAFLVGVSPASRWSSRTPTCRSLLSSRLPPSDTPPVAPGVWSSVGTWRR